jgi:protein-tyrosine sulfotransferase
MNLDTIKKAFKNRIIPQKGAVYLEGAYDWHADIDAPKEKALLVSREIRGVRRPPAIMLHGVMRRSGTNFVHDLLNLHPDLCGNPGEIYEAPFLASSHLLTNAQEVFLSGYQRNRDIFSSSDFLPLFGAAFIAYLYSVASDGQQVLVKIPGVERIWDFRHVFPNEKLVVLQRDGRDLIASTIKTWPNTDFKTACRRWHRSQQLILKFGSSPEYRNIRFVKFEEAVTDPKAFAKKLLADLDIDDTRYPYDKVHQLPVKGSSEHKVDGKMSWKAIKKPKSFNPIGRWTQWTDRQKRIFKQICGETLIQSGYAEDLAW